MELIDYVRIVRRRWLLILLVLVACTAGAGLATEFSTIRYTATTQLIVNGSSSISATDEVATRELADERAVAFSQIAATSPAVQAALSKAEASHGPFSPRGGPSVSASATGTSPFVYLHVSDTDARRAQAVANAYAAVLPTVIQKLEQTTVATPEEIAVVSPAGLPGSPFKHNLERNLLIGLGLGLVLGGGVALVRESVDRRLKDSQDVETATGLTVLGVIPFELPSEAIPAQTHPMSLRAEAYRKVRTNLTFVTQTGAPRSVVVTSSSSSEGKTSLSTNLAIACARSGQKVVLVDADLRRPMVNTFLQVSSDKGLVDVLAGTTELSEATQYVEEGGIHVIVSGPVPTNPSELLGSKRMLDTIRRLETDFDIVIIDTPPVLPVADALLLGVNVDGVVVVTRLGETTRDKLRRTKEGLEKVHANIFGVVPNGAIQREDSAYAYAYRYRSHGKPLSIPYAPRDPQVEPRPDDLVPAWTTDRPSDSSDSQPDNAVLTKDRTTPDDRPITDNSNNGTDRP